MLSGVPVIYGINPNSSSTVPEHDVGAIGVDKTGRKFRYIQAGSSAITAGYLQCAPSPNTNHHDIAVQAAAAAQATTVTVTLGATAATANEYSNGYLVINDEAGEGYTYRIKSHPAADASANLELTLYDPIVEALTTSSEACLVHNAYNGVQESTTQTLQPVGVAAADIAASSYGWVLSQGVTGALADENLTLGSLLTIGSSVAGALEAMDDVTAPIVEWAVVGYAIVAGVDGEFFPIYVDLE